MFVVMKNDTIWGYYDTQAEAIAAIEEERGKEDGVELVMIHEEDGTPEEGRKRKRGRTRPGPGSGRTSES